MFASTAPGIDEAKMRSCKPEIVRTEVDRRHEVALESVVIVVRGKVKLIEACMACRKTSWAGIPVELSLVLLLNEEKMRDLLVNTEQGIALHALKILKAIQRDLTGASDEL